MLQQQQQQQQHHQHHQHLSTAAVEHHLHQQHPSQPVDVPIYDNGARFNGQGGPLSSFNLRAASWGGSGPGHGHGHGHNAGVVVGVDDRMRKDQQRLQNHPSTNHYTTPTTQQLHGHGHGHGHGQAHGNVDMYRVGREREGYNGQSGMGSSSGMWNSSTSTTATGTATSPSEYNAIGTTTTSIALAPMYSDERTGPSAYPDRQSQVQSQPQAHSHAPSQAQSSPQLSSSQTQPQTQGPRLVQQPPTSKRRSPVDDGDGETPPKSKRQKSQATPGSKPTATSKRGGHANASKKRGDAVRIGPQLSVTTKPSEKGKEKANGNG
ncbi:hypothetical protein H0H93_001450, partial [Arthromyces matolae]